MSKQYKSHQIAFIRAAEQVVGVGGKVRRKEAYPIAESAGLQPPNWFINDPKYRVGRGYYVLPILDDANNVVEVQSTEVEQEVVAEPQEQESLAIQ